MGHSTKPPHLGPPAAVLVLPAIPGGPPPPPPRVERAIVARLVQPTTAIDPAASPAPEPADALPTIPLLAPLDEALRRDLLRRGRAHTLGDGEPIVRQGDEGGSIFILLDGAAEVRVEGHGEPIAHLVAGDFFGEDALVTSLPRPESVVAVGAVKVIELDGDRTAELLRARPEALDFLHAAFRDRLADRIAATSPLFAARDAAAVRALLDRFRFVEASPATALLRQDQPASGLFVLLRGACDVLLDGISDPVDELLPGWIAGGGPLLLDEPSGATVATRGRAWLLHLPRADFVALLEAGPPTADLLRAFAEERRG